MVFRQQELLDRLVAIEQRLDRIESAVADAHDSSGLHAELRAKDERIDALAEQGLHALELLAQARRELADLKKEAGSA
ncbi:MAG: hypothetical protein AAF628_16060 [Planctomycetota bacterium]